MQTLQYSLSAGINLTAHAYGDPTNPPVILSHGGGQTRHSWGGTAQALADSGWYAIAYDHRGHGESSWCEDGNYHVDHFAQDLRELAAQMSSLPVLIGASLGGISALVAEGEADHRVFRAIVLVDIVPRMNLEGAHNVISFMGAHLEEGFASLEEAADVITKYTGRPRRKDVSGLRKNLRLNPDGRYRWHWDPQFVLQRNDASQFTDGDQLVEATRKIDIPLLLVRGQLSDLVTEALAQEFLELKPDARYVDVKNARHMVAGDRNDIFTAAIVEFLEDLARDTSAT